MARVTKHASVGDVTALCLVEDASVLSGSVSGGADGGDSSSGRQPPLLMAGIGGFVHAYDLSSCAPLAQLQVLDGCRVHGLVAAAWGPGRALLACHGDRTIKVLLLDLRRSSSSEGGAAAPVVLGCVATLRLGGWVMDAALSACRGASGGGGGGGGALLYAGLSDNTVQAWRLEAPADGAVGWRAARILTAECTERCLLYSMRLALDPPAPPGAGGRGYDGGASRATAATERLFAAAGTIFNEVLVWRLPALPRSPSAAEPSAASLAALAARWAAIEARLTAACGGGPPALAAAAPAPSVSRVVTVAPLYRLCGHEGSIHRVSWIPGAWQLASCSDDRTARLWSLSGAAHGRDGELTVRIAPAATLWGHTSRVWDVAVSGGLAMTGSEDATARVWDADSGAQLAALQGHGGRGVWRLLPAPGQHLATAGADGTVKLWHLPAWLAQQRRAPLLAGGEAGDVGGAGAYIIPAARVAARWQALSPGAAADREWVRCVEWAGRDVLCLATNAGLVHRVALPSGGVNGGNERWRTLLVGASPIVSSCVARHAGGRFLCTGQMDGWAAVVDLNDPALSGGEDDGSAGGAGRPPPPPPLHRWQPHGGAAVISVFAAHSPLPVPSAFTASHDSVVRWWRLGTAAGCAPPQLLAQASLAACLPGRTLGGRGFSGKAAAMDVDAARRLWLVGDHTGSVLLLRLPDELGVDGSAPPALASPVAVFRAAHGACAVNLVRFSPDGGARTAGRDGCICAFEPVAAAAAGGATLILASTEHVSAVNSIAEVAAPAGVSGGSGRLLAGFASNRLVVWSEARGAELLSIDCGGQRRPHALRLRGPQDAAFAYVRGSELAVHRLQPPTESSADQGARGDTARSLGAAWHGREANACLALQVPGGGALVLSGGEDGAVRALAFGCSSGLGLPRSSHLGDHPTGAAVRCLHAAPSGTGCWLLVSGGAKAVLAAWELRAKASGTDGSGPPQLTHRLLATRPPRGGVRPKRTGGGGGEDAGRAELRVFALAVLPLAGTGSPMCADIVTASSDASLAIVRLQVGARTWTETASLQSLGAPVLALAALTLGARMLLIGGATSGAVGVWDVTAAPSLGACSGGGPPPRLPLLRTLPALHQSGVNCLAALPLLGLGISGGASQRALLVCGGDDQALSAMLLEAPSGAGGAESLQVLASTLHPNAHGSALRGVAILPGNSGRSLAFSTGLDQVLRCWSVVAEADGVSISQAPACALETLEPAALGACAGDSAGAVHVAVAGRGAQLVSFEGIG